MPRAIRRSAFLVGFTSMLTTSPTAKLSGVQPTRCIIEGEPASTTHVPELDARWM
jgi:hypothetical protein